MSVFLNFTNKLTQMKRFRAHIIDVDDYHIGVFCMKDIQNLSVALSEMHRLYRHGQIRCIMEASCHEKTRNRSALCQGSFGNQDLHGSFESRFHDNELFSRVFLIAFPSSLSEKCRKP